jgi:hypothetical protein
VKLFDYLDMIALDDGSVKIKAFISLLNGGERRRDSRDDDTENQSRRNDAARVFRSQPYLLEELTRLASTLIRNGRYKFFFTSGLLLYRLRKHMVIVLETSVTYSRTAVM